MGLGRQNQGQGDGYQEGQEGGAVHGFSLSRAFSVRGGRCLVPALASVAVLAGSPVRLVVSRVPLGANGEKLHVIAPRESI
jgi:hypothetical protein